MINARQFLSSALVTKNLARVAAMSIRNVQSDSSVDHFKTLAVTTPKPFVFQVELNRPDKLNAMNKTMWTEIKDCFERLSINPDCRAVILSGAGKHFSAGNDLMDMMKIGQELAQFEDVGRKGQALERIIELYQQCISSLEICPKPVIAAVHSACVGAGANLITAADIRYCSQDTFFQIAEIQIGMPADVGVLQRLPKIIGNQSIVRELCFTGRKLFSDEAKEIGLVSQVLADRDSVIAASIDLAETIAALSPTAVQATKKNIIYSLEHTNQEGLDHIRAINKLLLQGEDFANAVGARITKTENPEFSKL